MDAFSAGQLSRAFDRLHSTIYFAAEASDRFSELGLENQRMQYFASRSAPMGAVTAKVVAATFYNFNPELVAKVIRAAWGIASPATAIRVRYEIVDTLESAAVGRHGRHVQDAVARQRQHDAPTDPAPCREARPADQRSVR